MSDYSMPEGAQLGHINLRVADLDRAVAFYTGVLGLVETGRFPGQAAFLSAGGAYYHHIVVTVTPNTAPLANRSLGLDHIAINLPTRRDLALAAQRLIERDWPISGTADYGTHLAVYLKDPDGNGLELAWDRDPAEWRRTDDGKIWFGPSEPLPIEELLSELETAQIPG